MAVDARLELPSPLGDIEGLAFLEAFAWAELPSPLGDIEGLVEVVPLALVELPSPLVNLKIVAGPVVSFVRGALLSPVGDLAAVGFVPVASFMAFPSPLGALRVSAKVTADHWGAGGTGGCGCPTGFPLPRIQGYSYQRDAGLVRTKMLSGGTLQRRKWTDAYRQATVSFEICTSRLYDMEAFIDEQGYDWFGMKLVTGDNAAETAELHQVRIIADPSYGDVYGENITVSLSIEMQEAVVPDPPPELVVTHTFYPDDPYVFIENWGVYGFDQAYINFTNSDLELNPALAGVYPDVIRVWMSDLSWFGLPGSSVAVDSEEGTPGEVEVPGPGFPVPLDIPLDWTGDTSQLYYISFYPGEPADETTPTLAFTKIEFLSL